MFDFEELVGYCAHCGVHVHYTHARGKLLGVHIGVYQPQSITPFQKFEP
jgi:hypothetical protein